MGILDIKQQIYGDIAAAKSLTGGLPPLKTTSSLSSVNNGGNTLAFLTDLIRSLVGYQELQTIIENIISQNLPEIERDVKKALKDSLKGIVNCGVNPSIPTWLKSTGTGVKYRVSHIDFQNLIFTSPTSDVGHVLYNDVQENLLDSSDFNTFLYQVIQNNGTVERWGHITSASDILTFSFKNKDISGTDPNNTLTVKAHPSYDTKTLTDLNNDYVDSVQLFNAQNILTNLIDTAYGTVSVQLNKSLTQLQNEARLEAMVTKIANSGSNDVLNDTYFHFTNQELNLQQYKATQRSQGVQILNTNVKLPVSVPFSSVAAMNSAISGATNPLNNRIAVASSLNVIGNDIGQFAPNASDQITVKLDFIQGLIMNLTKCIMDTVLSPKVVAIFLLNFKIVYGQNADYKDGPDFFSKNRNLMHEVIKNIGASIIKILVVFALKEIAKLVAESIAKKELDKNRLYVAQLLTFVGIPPEILGLINQLI